MTDTTTTNKSKQDPDRREAEVAKARRTVDCFRRQVQAAEAEVDTEWENVKRLIDAKVEADAELVRVMTDPSHYKGEEFDERELVRIATFGGSSRQPVASEIRSRRRAAMCAALEADDRVQQAAERYFEARSTAFEADNWLDRAKEKLLAANDGNISPTGGDSNGAPDAAERAVN